MPDLTDRGPLDLYDPEHIHLAPTSRSPQGFLIYDVNPYQTDYPCCGDNSPCPRRTPMPDDEHPVPPLYPGYVPLQKPENGIGWTPDRFRLRIWFPNGPYDDRLTATWEQVTERARRLVENAHDPVFEVSIIAVDPLRDYGR